MALRKHPHTHTHTHKRARSRTHTNQCVAQTQTHTHMRVHLRTRTARFGGPINQDRVDESGAARLGSFIQKLNNLTGLAVCVQAGRRTDRGGPMNDALDPMQLARLNILAPVKMEQRVVGMYARNLLCMTKGSSARWWNYIVKVWY